LKIITTVITDIRKIQKWTIILYLVGLVISLPLFLGYIIPIPAAYLLWLKVIHIAGVVILMGNMVIGPLWITYAINSKENNIIHFAMKTICWADIYFSIPGVIVVLISGLMLAPTWGGYDKTSWITASLILLALSGIPAIPTLRAQYKLYRLSYESVQNNKLEKIEFNRAMWIWSVWGTIAIILPLVSFVFMITKPTLW